MAQSLGKTSSIRFVYLLNMLPVIGLMVFYYTRYLEGTYTFVIPLGLTMMWLVLTLLTGKEKRLISNDVSRWWMVYLFLSVMMVIIGLSSTNLNFVISRLPIYIIPAIGYFVVRHYNRKEKAVILTGFAVVYFANLIYNIFLGFQLPEIFEEQASTEESIEFSIMMNIADTGFLEVAYWLIGALIMTILVVKEKKWRFLCMLLTVPLAYHMLFQNTRGTAILLLMVEMAGFFLAYHEPSQQRNRHVYYLFTVLMLVLLSFIVFIPLMGWLMEHLQSERLADRLNDLVDFKKSGGDLNNVSEGSFSQRMILAQTSLSTFFSSPISFFIGIGDHTQAFGGDLVKSGIGGHSEFIDVLARFGLLGAFVYWKIMKSYYMMLKRMTSKREIRKYVNIIFVIVIFSGILNVLFRPVLQFFLFLVFPVIIEFTAIKNKITYTK